jgi:hypothetical protein
LVITAELGREFLTQRTFTGQKLRAELWREKGVGMGLDVYLYKIEDIKEKKLLEAKYEEQSTLAWDFGGAEYDDLTEEQKDIARGLCEDVAEQLGLDKYGEYAKQEKIEIDHRGYPEHMFKIGYFRSSYNDGGINAILRNAGLKTLSWIFQQNEEYEFCPDWEVARERASQLREQLAVYINENGALGCMKITHNELVGFVNNEHIDSEAKAMEVYLAKMRGRKADDLPFESEGFSCREGEFFDGKPLRVKGIITGANNRFFVDQKLPAHYVIYELDSLDWYLQALEIVHDTCIHVLEQDDQHKYYLHWSG